MVERSPRASRRRIGSTLGDYAIGSAIGRGGMSVVYLARHTALGNEAFVEIGGRSYAGSLSPYWVTIEEGIVTRIEEQLLP